MSHLNNKMNPYAELLGDRLDEIPKAVLGAIAVSLASGGGERLADAAAVIAHEWAILHQNGIVPQSPKGDWLRLARECPSSIE